MVKLISGGGAAQVSATYILNADLQAVRHEQSLQVQTDHVRTGPYLPRVPLKGQTHAEWQAELAKQPQRIGAAVGELTAALAEIEAANPPATKRPVSHRMGRALNSLISLPDAGNVKHNREKAVRLSTPPLSTALRQRLGGAKTVAAPDADPGYAGLPLYKEALTRLQRRDVVVGLEAQALEWQAALPAAAEAGLRTTVAAAVATLGAAATRHRQDADTALETLRLAQQAEIAVSLSALRGLTFGPDETGPAEMSRQLRVVAEELTTRPIDLSEDAMPVSLLIDIFLGALAEARKAAPAAVAGAAEVDADEALEQRLYAAVASLPGGLLAFEQLDGQKIADKGRRVATRVHALASHALQDLAPQDPRRPALRQALAAAQKKRDGAPVDSAAELAAYGALRNGFLLGPGQAGQLDQDLAYADQRLDKAFGDWVTRAAPQPALRKMKGPLLDKTPFDASSLRLANQISTLGYDSAARPMKRLDGALQDVRAGLLARREQIAAVPLDAAVAARLAALLVCADKAQQHNGLAANAAVDAKRRPGEIVLDAGDLAAVSAKMTALGLRADTTGAPAGQSSAMLLTQAASAALRDGATRFADALEVVALVDQLGRQVNLDTPHATPAAGALRKNADIARDLVSTAQIDNISSLDDLFKFLEPKVQQFELRGKIKISSGGNIAVSSKALTWPVDVVSTAVGGVNLPVRGELKGNLARNAVFEIGFSTTGFEIFIGSEARKGGGAGAGVGVRGGYAEFLSSGAGVDKTWSADQADTEGIWLRLPRNKDDDATRAEAQALLRTLAQQYDGAAAAATPADAMPARIAVLLAQHPNLSLSVVERYREKNQRNELALSAAVLNVKTGGGDESGRFGILSGGLKSERRNKQFELSDRTGFMTITRKNALSGGIVFAQGGALSIGMADGAGRTDVAPTFANGFSYARQLAEKGIDTKMRYITRDGQTDAVDSRVDLENLDFNDHRRRIDLERRAWIATGAKELFKSEAAAATPRPEQMRVAEEWLEQMLAEASRQSQGNARHVYSLSYAMLTSVAATLDGMRAKAALARRGGDAATAAKLDAQIDDLLQHPSAWRPWKITASERTSEKQQRGAVLGVSLGGTTTAEGQRGTNSYPK